MNLGEIRTQFIKHSGRNDLLNEDDSDNGANYFINAGQRWLDRKIDHKKSWGSYFFSISLNGYYAKVPNLRSAEQVWINDSEERWELTRKDLRWMREEYYELVSATTSGNPSYWCPVNLRGVETTQIDSLGAFFNYFTAQTADLGYTGIIFLPHADESYVLEVSGRFWTPEFSSDTDETYWSSIHPDVLIKAALMQLEIHYRNSEGANDWRAALAEDILDIDKDEVAEQIAHVSYMEG